MRGQKLYVKRPSISNLSSVNYNHVHLLALLPVAIERAKKYLLIIQIMRDVMGSWKYPHNVTA
jgi:hypothetical protein